MKRLYPPYPKNVAISPAVSITNMTQHSFVEWILLLIVLQLVQCISARHHRREGQRDGRPRRGFRGAIGGEG